MRTFLLSVVAVAAYLGAVVAQQKGDAALCGLLFGVGSFICGYGYARERNEC